MDYKPGDVLVRNKYKTTQVLDKFDKLIIVQRDSIYKRTYYCLALDGIEYAIDCYYLNQSWDIL